MAEQLDFSSGVSVEQSMGSIPGHGTCVLGQVTFKTIFASSDGTLSHLLGLVAHVKEPRTLRLASYSD